MELEPAHVNQVRVAADGRVYEIDAQASTVAADLRAIDAGLRVRFSERGSCWIVYHLHHADCPHNGPGGEGSEYLVRSIQAHQSGTGVWTGLDDRIVERMREIQPGGRSGYNYAQELQVAAERRGQEQRAAFREQVGETAERAAHALRKELGERYRGRAFVPRSVT